MEKYSGALTFENFGNTFFFFISMLTSATLAHSQTGWVAIRGGSAPRTAALLGRARCEPRKARQRAYAACACKHRGSSVQGRAPGELQVPGGWHCLHVLWVSAPDSSPALPSHQQCSYMSLLSRQHSCLRGQSTRLRKVLVHRVHLLVQYWYTHSLSVLFCLCRHLFR